MLRHEVVICVGCGERFLSMKDVEQFRVLGLALYGHCKLYGGTNSINKLWTLSEVQEYDEKQTG